MGMWIGIYKGNEEKFEGKDWMANRNIIRKKQQLSVYLIQVWGPFR